MIVTFSIVGSRRSCAKAIKNMAVSKDIGVITEVKQTRVGWFTWHTECRGEAIIS